MDKWDAKDYAKNSQNQYKWGMEVVEQAGVKTGESVLDIGCGDGKITAQIARKAFDGRVVGIDASGKMLKLGRELFPGDEYSNLSFKKSDAQDFNFDGVFDIAFSNACLHWMKDQNKVLKNVYKALRPGGRVFFQMGGKGNAGIMNKLMDKQIKKDKWKKYFKGFKGAYWFYSPAEYKKFLAESGLKPVRVYLVPKVAEHKGEEGLTAWFRTTWLPYTHLVPVSLRETFISEAVDSFTKATKQMGNTVIKMPMMRLQVEAVKPL